MNKTGNTLRRFIAAVTLSLTCGAQAVSGPYFVKGGGDDTADGLSWATAKASVAGAVAAVAESGEVGCEIRVAGGVYVHTSSITLPAAGVTIRGGYDPVTEVRDPAANRTVLSGDKNGNDQWKLIDFSASTPDTAISYAESEYGACISDGELVLPEPEELGVSKFLMPDSGKVSDNVQTGFIVSGGITVFDGLYLVGFYQSSGTKCGASINNESAATDTKLTVTNCVFAGMCAGRGVVDFTKVSGALFTKTRFLYNRSSRLIEIKSSNNRFEDCDFVGSWKTGDSGGNVIDLYGGSGNVISNCLFSLNFIEKNTLSQGPGNIVGGQSIKNLSLIGCVVQENYTRNNMPLIAMGNGTMRNCLFRNNRTAYTTEQAPSIMNGCDLAESCTFISNTVYVAITAEGKTVLTAPALAINTRIPFINCTFVDNRSYTHDSNVSTMVIEASAAVVRTTSATSDACVGLANCTFWQTVDIPVLVCGGVPSSGLYPSKIVSSVLQYAGPGQGGQAVVGEQAFPIEVLKCSVRGFSSEFDSSVSATGIVTDDLALDKPTVVNSAHKVPVMRVGARVPGNEDTYFVGNFNYRDVAYPVYEIEDGYQYLLEGNPAKKSNVRVEPYSAEPIPDALGKPRIAGSDQRGAVTGLLPAAITGKTLIIRAKPEGICTFEGPTTQAVQPGEPSVPVLATGVAPGSDFQSWQLEDGTVVSDKNPLALDSLLDDLIVYAVYSAEKVTYTFDLGAAGTFDGSGQSTIDVAYSVGDVPVVPKYTIDEKRYLDRGWDLPSVVGNEDKVLKLDYVEKLHRIVRYDSEAESGGDGESWATAMNDLEAAIAKAALWTGEVWIKAGIHKPAASMTRSFLLASHVAIKGGFSGIEGETEADRDIERNRSILSGDLDDNDMWATSAGAAVSVIDPNTNDFTPVNPGHADDWWWVTSFDDNVSSMFNLATVTCDESAVLDGVWMTGCKNYVYGGKNAHPTIKDCVFVGAGRITLAGAMEINGCRFLSCSANDGGVTGCLYCDSVVSAPGVVVTNTLFDGVRGSQRGAITGNGGSLKISFIDCTFSHCYMDPVNKSVNNGHSACLGGNGFSATASRCRFVGNKTVYFGNIFAAAAVSDSLFEGNVIEADASAFPGQRLTLLRCESALRCSFVSNRVIRTGSSAAASCEGCLVEAIDSLIGCTFDGNEVRVSLEESCETEPRAAMVYVNGDVKASIAHCTFVDNEASIAVFRAGGTRTSATYPLTIVNTIFAGRYGRLFDMSADMSKTVYGWHFVGSWIPGFDESADYVASAVNVVSDVVPRFVPRPVRCEFAEGRMVYRDYAAFKAAVPVFCDATGAWAMVLPDGVVRDLKTYSVVEPVMPTSSYSDAFGSSSPAGKRVPGALQTYQKLGLVVILN